MKVVLFCGGAGMRLRDYSEKIPKPLVEVGPRPILWHLMSYYARYGHTDFVLCLGHGGAAIKDYFLKYDECASNDFVRPRAGAGSSCSPATSTPGASRSWTRACTRPSASA